MAQNEVLKVLIQNDKILKQVSTKEVTSLSSALPVPYAVGDILYASSSTTLSRLADVAAGSYLRSGGVTTAPLWSTLTLPNAATTGDILYASGTNAIGNLADVATGNVLRSGGVGAAPAYGKVTLTTDVTGVLGSSNGGTGVNNAGTITNASNTTITGGGTISLGGFTFTVPATGTAVLLGTTQTITGSKTFSVNIEAAAGIDVGATTAATAGQVVALVSDAGTANQAPVFILNHTSSGTPAANFGTSLVFQAKSSSTVDRTQGDILAAWIVATDASRTAALFFRGYDSVGGREFLRGGANGSAAVLGFYGATAITKPAPTGSRGGNAALASLLTALANLGLITDSTSA